MAQTAMVEDAAVGNAVSKGMVDAEGVDVRITGRHMEVGEAMRVRVAERLAELLAHYYGTEAGDGWHADVTFTRADREKDRGRFCADITIHLERGGQLEATGRAHEAGPAFEEAAERVEKRLRRHRRRLKGHRAPRKGFGPEAIEMAYAVLTAPPEDDEIGDDFAPAIVAESVKGAETHTVASAVMALDMGDAPVLVFRNAADERINLVYRRSDGNVGWLDTGRTA